MSLKNPYKSGGMFEGASHIIFANAKHLRNNMTDAEKVLWFYLKTGSEGLKFRRQHPIGIYIADFYCHEKQLVIEVDGEYHFQNDQPQYDAWRTEILEDLGVKVIRFSNRYFV